MPERSALHHSCALYDDRVISRLIARFIDSTVWDMGNGINILILYDRAFAGAWGGRSSPVTPSRQLTLCGENAFRGICMLYRMKCINNASISYAHGMALPYKMYRIAPWSCVRFRAEKYLAKIRTKAWRGYCMALPYDLIENTYGEAIYMYNKYRSTCNIVSYRERLTITDKFFLYTSHIKTATSVHVMNISYTIMMKIS